MIFSSNLEYSDIGKRRRALFEYGPRDFSPLNNHAEATRSTR
jgi:hypothetical protein